MFFLLTEYFFYLYIYLIPKQILITFPWLERFQLAKEAFDGWAGRVREFLDSEVELTGGDAEHAGKAYRPYGSGGLQYAESKEKERRKNYG